MRPSLSNRKAEGLSKAKSESFCALEALTSLAVRDLEKLYGMVVRYVSSGMLDMVKRISYIQHETPQCGGGLQYLHYLVVWAQCYHAHVRPLPRPTADPRVLAFREALGRSNASTNTYLFSEMGSPLRLAVPFLCPKLALP